MKLSKEQVKKILNKSNIILCLKCTNDNVRDVIQQYRDGHRDKVSTDYMIKAYRTRNMCMDCVAYQSVDAQFVANEINKLIEEEVK